VVQWLDGGLWSEKVLYSVLLWSQNLAPCKVDLRLQVARLVIQIIQPEAIFTPNVRSENAVASREVVHA